MTIARRAIGPGMLLAACCLAAGCENGGGGPGGGIPIIISATWTDEADDTHTITFRSPDDGQTSGVVTGREEDVGDCLNGCPIGGYWQNGRLEITVDRGNDVRPKFVSEFHQQNPTRLQFNQVGGSESFALVQ